MTSALRSVFLAGTTAVSRAIGRPSSPSPAVAYVVAVVSSDIVGICSMTNLARDFEAIKSEVPSAKVGYILPVTADAKMIACLAEGNLIDSAIGGGWFRTSLDQAEAAIDAAARAYTGVTPFHTSSEAVIAAARRRR